MKFAYHSDIGQKRSINQDRCCVLKNKADQIFGIVCDGMGGHLAGETAAQMAMDMLCQAFAAKDVFCSESEARQWLLEEVEEANHAIYEDAKQNSQHAGMGTTLVAVLCMKNSTIICHAGDSRAYIYDHLDLHQLTKDHTYVNLLVENGSITQEQAKYHPQKHVLMKAVGVFDHLVATIQVCHDLKGTLLLGSDGLYNFISPQEIKEILDTDEILEKKTLELVQKANNNGGMDNISCVLIDLEGGESDE